MSADAENQAGAELLPCPFCGMQPQIHRGVTATCVTGHCAILGRAVPIAEWNRRAPAPVAALVKGERAREELEHAAKEKAVHDVGAWLLRYNGHECDPDEMEYSTSASPEPIGEAWQNFETEAREVVEIIAAILSRHLPASQDTLAREAVKDDTQIQWAVEEIFRDIVRYVSAPETPIANQFVEGKKKATAEILRRHFPAQPAALASSDNFELMAHQEAWQELANKLGIKGWPMQLPRLVSDWIIHHIDHTQPDTLAALRAAEGAMMRSTPNCRDEHSNDQWCKCGHCTALALVRAARVKLEGGE